MIKKIKKYLIGIQARSNSTRLPNKAHLILDDKPILQHVIDTCNKAASYMNRQYEKYGAVVSTALLIPENDLIYELYRDKINIIQGNMEDVLSRYVKAFKDEGCDYIVRITADCAFMESYAITRCIKSSIIKRKPLTTNIIVRTSMEGLDVEIFDKTVLEWLDKNAKGEHREHVTSLITEYVSKKEKLPFEICNVMDKQDLSYIHTSIDTQEDYENAKKKIDLLKNKRRLGESYGCIVD